MASVAELKKSFFAEIDKVENREDLEKLRVKYLGREKGILTAVLRSLGGMPSVVYFTCSSLDDAHDFSGVDLRDGECRFVRAKYFGDFRVEKKFQIGAERSLNATKLLGRLFEVAAKCSNQFMRTLVAFVHQRFDGGIGILLMEQEPVNVRNRDICVHVPEDFKAGLDGELRFGREKGIAAASSGQ